MSWISHHVGGPGPQLSPATPSGPSQSTPNGPISSATVNPVLQPIAAAEQKADALAQTAGSLAQAAAAMHDGYPAALAAIGAAVSAWRMVQRLAGKIASSSDTSAAMAQAKVQVPGIMATADHAIQGLRTLYQQVKADQAAHRPDLPPAADEPDEGGLGWGALAIGAGIVYLLWKAVF